MKAIKYTYLLGLFVFFSQQSLYGQDVEGLWQKFKNWPNKVKEKFGEKPSITGGVNTLFNYNYVSGIAQRNDPFNYQFNAYLNLKLYGINIPLAANFSNGRFVYNYQLPSYKLPSYAFLGISPKYKWATLHLGDRSMNFSPYTLSGHSFRGLGVELQPGKFRFAAMYGRLRRAVAEDLNNPNNLEPVFKRKGWGFSVGYEGEKDNIKLIVFQAWDDLNSIPEVTINDDITAQDNTIISLVGRKQLSKLITVSGDYAYSAYNRDRSTPQVYEDVNIFNKMMGLFKPRVSSSYNFALKTSIGLNLKFGTIAVNHERVEPGYRTLGALFFNDDFENFTFSANTKMFKNKLLLASNLGIQRNNINGTADNSQNRVVGSVNLAYTPNPKLNINLAYSNFKNTNRIRTSTIPLIQVDSIKLSQISQNANATVSYVTGADQNLMFNGIFSFQNARTIENDEVLDNQRNSNYMLNLMETYIFPTSKIRLTAAVMGNYNVLPIVKSQSITPSLSIALPLLEDNLNITATSSYVYVDIITTNTISHLINFQTNVNYQFFEKHKIGFMLGYVNKLSGDTFTDDFQELTSRLNYNWSF